MALFNGNVNQQGSRSNTALVRSGHMSPSEKWILDPAFLKADMSGVFRDGVLFNYQYGGPGMDEVVIPKGRVVGVSGFTKDFVTKKMTTVITLPGLATNGNTIGMAPYNFTKDMLQQDRFGGNQPSIITLDYVKLPYMPGMAPESTMDKSGLLKEEQKISIENRMPWGAVIGEVENGDYVVSTASGRLRKYKEGTDKPHEIVGQVLAMDLNAEPYGWLKWMLWEEQYRKDDDAFMNRSGASNLPSDNGYPFDPGYAEGNTIFQNYQSELVSNPTGIVGLHDGSGNYDGFGKNDTEYTDIALGTKETSKAFLGTFKDFAGGVIGNIQPGVIVKVGGTPVAAEKLTIDYKQGIFTIAADVTETGAVTATYKAMHYGTPSYSDFKGVHGEVFVLLKK